MHIWVLFVILLIQGQPHHTVFAFETEKACEAHKAVVMNTVALEYPNDPGSYTCFQTDLPGKVT